MTKFLRFECPHCYTTTMSTVVVIERSTTVRLLEGGLMTYPERPHSNRLVDFDETTADVYFRCNGCLTPLIDSCSDKIRSPQSLYAYLLDQADGEQKDETA